MNVFRSIAMAFSMFSILPMPNIEWKRENMRYMLACLPLVGVLIGLVLYLWFYLSELLCFGNILFAAGVTLLPIFLSGAVHMDGFCDTVDALASHAPKEKKREILKDSHAGAFAIIGVGVYLILYFAIATELPRKAEVIFMVALMHVISRAASGFSGVVFPTSAGEGLLKLFHESASKTVAIIILLCFFAAAAAGLLFINTLVGIVMVGVVALLALSLYFLSKKQFGGMSGDLAGYLLQVSELGMLLALIIMSKVVGL